MNTITIKIDEDNDIYEMTVNNEVYTLALSSAFAETYFICKSLQNAGIALLLVYDLYLSKQFMLSNLCL